MGASATAGREQGALPASLAAAVYGRSEAVQELLSLLAAAGGHMTPAEVADAVQNVHLTSPVIPALLWQLTEQRVNMHGLGTTELQALVQAALYWDFNQIVELLPPAFAARFLPSAASQQDPAFLLRLLRRLGRTMPCSASTQELALLQAIRGRQPLAVTALLAAGAQPTAATITQAICSCQPSVLRAMLAVARPPEPPLQAGLIDLCSSDCAARLPSFVHQALLLAAKVSGWGVSGSLQMQAVLPCFPGRSLLACSAMRAC